MIHKKKTGKRSKGNNTGVSPLCCLMNCYIGFISGLISGNGLGTKNLWTPAKWYIGGKSYFFPPLKIIATKQFAKGLANYTKSVLFGQINKLL